jgi:RNA-directed DNA polymerase
MSLGTARHQKCGQPQRTVVKRGEAASEAVSDEAALARHAQTDWGVEDLLGQALTRENMAAAWKRVKANKGSAGVDGRSVQDTGEYLKQAWPDIRSRVLDGSYRPDPVRRVGIPKPSGGVRELGIPTVVDRLIQQALLQVLQPRLSPPPPPSPFWSPPPTARYSRRSSTCRTATGSSWTWIWRNSSTASITTS